MILFRMAMYLLATPALQTNVTTTLFWPVSYKQKATVGFWKIFSFLIKKAWTELEPWSLYPASCLFSHHTNIMSRVLATTLWLWGSTHKNESQYTIYSRVERKEKKSIPCGSTGTVLLNQHVQPLPEFLLCEKKTLASICLKLLLLRIPYLQIKKKVSNWYIRLNHIEFLISMNF